jgi:alpha-tubulin suppressor-like RCC1 family protein
VVPLYLQRVNDGMATVEIDRRAAPRHVPGFTNGTVNVSRSDFGSSLVVRSDGTVWGWGLNNNGQLGDGTIIDRSTPVRVSG